MVKGSLLDRLKLPSHHQDYLLAFVQPPSCSGSDRCLPLKWWEEHCPLVVDKQQGFDATLC